MFSVITAPIADHIGYARARIHYVESRWYPLSRFIDRVPLPSPFCSHVYRNRENIVKKARVSISRKSLVFPNCEKLQTQTRNSMEESRIAMPGVISDEKGDSRRAGRTGGRRKGGEAHVRYFGKTDGAGNIGGMLLDGGTSAARGKISPSL